MLLGTSWLLNVGMQIGLQSFLGIGWLLIAASAEAEEVKLFAYLAAFLASIIVLGWVLVAPFWYLHLRTVLREAEAD
jgi:hypothetical protein